MHPDDMVVSIRQRKLACILDPVLVLGSPWGPSVALRLTRVMEAWLTRAFWQVIDASDMVIPRLPANDEAAKEAPLSRPLERALDAWIALRDSTDAASWPFRWVGDNFTESQVGDAADGGVVERYETLLDALLARCGSGADPSNVGDAGDADALSAWWNPMSLSLDTLALSATLDAAIVLTAQPDEAPPWPVRALQRCGIDVQHLDPLPADSLFGAERSLVRDALAAAGLAGMMQRLPPLAALHVIAEAPADAALLAAPRAPVRAADATADPWARATAWWYPVCPARQELAEMTEARA
ncbi:hypothetical protein [Paracidovorax citrulli]